MGMHVFHINKIILVNVHVVSSGTRHTISILSHLIDPLLCFSGFEFQFSSRSSIVQI